MARHFVALAMVALCMVAASMGKTVILDETKLDMQLKIYKLLFHVDQADLFWPEEYADFKLEDMKTQVDIFNNKFTIDEFYTKYHYGLLPRGYVFSVANSHHRDEAISLFRVLFNIKDFNSFYKFALWARVHVNEMMFIYALYLAVLHRPDTQYIRLPAMYESYPYFFYNVEVTQKSADIRTLEKGVKNKIEIDTYLVPANYSSWYIHHPDDHESKLNYLTEDIDWNNFYFFAMHDYPFLLSTLELDCPKDKYTCKRGEQFFFLHSQMINRYNLERLSNNMGEIEDFSWDKHFITGYYPTMAYHNGLPLPQRKSWSDFPVYKQKYIKAVKKFESRIEDAIDSGFIIGKDGKLVNIYTPEGFELLASIVEGNADSYNKYFYGSVVEFGRKVLGFSVEPSSKYHVVPSALENFSTSLRDPAFYRLYKRILHFLYEYKSNLPVYTYDELIAPGVKIESLAVDKIQTYFEYVDVPINNAVPVKSAPDASTFCVKVQQERLNYKPFTYHFTIQSDEVTKGFIRIFLGPKYDEYNNPIDISENWKNFLQVDEFLVELQAGVNKVERKSTESVYSVPDPEVYSDEFYMKVKKAFKNKQPLSVDDQLYGFPDRLMFPKGKEEGMPFQFFAYISVVKDEDLKVENSPIWGKKVFDGKSLGFPLDRPLFAYNFTVPNSYFKDVYIFHKASL